MGTPPLKLWTDRQDWKLWYYDDNDTSVPCKRSFITNVMAGVNVTSFTLDKGYNVCSSEETLTLYCSSSEGSELIWEISTLLYLSTEWAWQHLPGFPLDLENLEKWGYTWKTWKYHGILKNLINIMEKWHETWKNLMATKNSPLTPLKQCKIH